MIQKAEALYIEKKRTNSLLDYDDLIRFCIQLMEQDERTRRVLGETYRYIMVDEYQDTNAAQHRMVSLMAMDHQNLMVVGDDFQSIYSFRGADFRNIMSFPELYPKATVYRLEHNYRSTPEIMEYTNATIGNARVKFDKKLYSTKPSFLHPQVVTCEDSLAQSRFVATKILELYEQDIGLEEIGVLYRAHSHSIPIQVELGTANIPYCVRSGMKFYELAHIKDLFALAKVGINAADVLSWMRLLTLVPQVGTITAERVIAELVTSRRPEDELEKVKVPSAARDSIQTLAGLIREGRQLRNEPAVLLDRAYRQWYGALMPLKYDDAIDRERDVEAFIDIAGRYKSVRELVDTFILEDALSGMALKETEIEEGVVTLSSVHQAKGLEWPVVFLIQMLDGAFPSAWAARDDDQMEEERRLYYVATTRAKQYLYIVAPQVHRSAYGVTLQNRSRFVLEVPEELYDEVIHEGAGEELPVEIEDE